MYDSDGYPTDEALRQIHTWTGTPVALLEFASELFDHGLVRVTREGDDTGRPFRRYIFITGGWSGCESVLGALDDTFLWTMFWSKSERGGLVEFLLPDSQADFNMFWGKFALQVPETQGLDLDAIEARADAATPGPWEYWPSGSEDYGTGIYPGVTTVSHGDTIIEFDTGSRALNEAACSWKSDAQFIEHARTDVPPMSAEIRRLREIVAQLGL